MDEMDRVREAMHGMRLILAWVLQNKTPDGVLHIPYDELEVLDCASVQRIDDHFKQCIVFSLADPPKPQLAIVKET